MGRHICLRETLLVACTNRPRFHLSLGDLGQLVCRDESLLRILTACAGVACRLWRVCAWACRNGSRLSPRDPLQSSPAGRDSRLPCSWLVSSWLVNSWLVGSCDGSRSQKISEVPWVSCSSHLYCFVPEGAWWVVQ